MYILADLKSNFIQKQRRLLKKKTKKNLSFDVKDFIFYKFICKMYIGRYKMKMQKIKIYIGTKKSIQGEFKNKQVSLLENYNNIIYIYYNCFTKYLGISIDIFTLDEKFEKISQKDILWSSSVSYFGTPTKLLHTSSYEQMKCSF